jgi:hypothetical protein
MKQIQKQQTIRRPEPAAPGPPTADQRFITRGSRPRTARGHEFADVDHGAYKIGPRELPLTAGDIDPDGARCLVAAIFSTTPDHVRLTRVYRYRT